MNEDAFTTLESQRLLLRRFEESDLLPFLAYLNDPLVARYQSWSLIPNSKLEISIQKQLDLDRVCRGNGLLSQLN